MLENKVQGRVALITGGAAGIGAAIADRLAADGFNIIIADNNLEQAGKVAGTLNERGYTAHPVHIDVGRADSIAAAFQEVDQLYGRCDVLVNSAGVARGYGFLDFPLEEWQAILNINLTGTMLCCQQAGRLMLRHGWGRMINIASVAGLRAVGIGRSAYGTSKAGVIALTRQIAAELSVNGITCNAIAPGPVDTPMTVAFHTQQFRDTYTRAIPMGRYGLPEEIAATAAFLASDGTAYISGATLPVDGGFLASGARD